MKWRRFASSVSSSVIAWRWTWHGAARCRARSPPARQATARGRAPPSQAAGRRHSSQRDLTGGFLDPRVRRSGCPAPATSASSASTSPVLHEPAADGAGRVHRRAEDQGGACPDHGRGERVADERDALAARPRITGSATARRTNNGASAKPATATVASVTRTASSVQTRRPRTLPLMSRPLRESASSATSSGGPTSPRRRPVVAPSSSIERAPNRDQRRACDRASDRPALAHEHQPVVRVEATTSEGPHSSGIQRNAHGDKPTGRPPTTTDAVRWTASGSSRRKHLPARG